MSDNIRVQIGNDYNHFMDKIISPYPYSWTLDIEIPDRPKVKSVTAQGMKGQLPELTIAP